MGATEVSSHASALALAVHASPQSARLAEAPQPLFITSLQAPVALVAPAAQGLVAALVSTCLECLLHMSALPVLAAHLPPISPCRRIRRIRWWWRRRRLCHRLHRAPRWHSEVCQGRRRPGEAGRRAARSLRSACGTTAFSRAALCTDKCLVHSHPCSGRPGRPGWRRRLWRQLFRRRPGRQRRRR